MTNQQLKTISRDMMATGLFHDEQQALDVLVASSQALRDRLPKVEAFHLGTALPEPLRAAYFEGWQNGQRQAESVNKSEFLAEVEFHLQGYEDHSLAELVPMALQSILKMISGNEADYLKHALPKSLHDIFDARISME